MRPDDSPFPCQWIGTSLAKVGLGDVRPRAGTYGRYDFSRLPPVPFAMNGDLRWLADASHPRNIGEAKAGENAVAIGELRSSSRDLRLHLPEVFVKFMESPALHRRIRSNTDCFLDLCRAPVRSPNGEGHLIRFLADSQGCIYWYLYLAPDGPDHAVVASSGFYGTAAEQWQDEAPDPAKIAFCAGSFEEFLWRFWIENEIWFAGYKKTPMPDVGAAYIEQYRKQ